MKALALALGLLLAAQADAAPSLAGMVTWSGTRQIGEEVTVPAGSTLTLAAGTRLRFRRNGSLAVAGRLLAAGTPGKPIRLEGRKEAGAACIETRGSAAVVQLEHVEVSGAARGVRAQGGVLTCSDARFLRNEVGLWIDLKARATLEDVTFEGNAEGLRGANGARITARRLRFRKNGTAAAARNEAALEAADCLFQGNRRGLVAEKSSGVRLTACRFDGNDTGLEAQQTPRGPMLRGCDFGGNRVALSALLFANPEVESTSFAANRTAVHASQFCRPRLLRCCLDGNGEAVRLDKHADAAIEGCRLEGNDTALFADFSSYPAVRGNLFADNAWHVRLGNYQSADWERRQGGAPVGREREGRAAGPGAPAAPQAPPAGGRLFSVAGNAWDAETSAEMAAGEEANVSRFWDGRDRPSQTYQGSRGESFSLDVIRFLPAADAASLPGLPPRCAGPPTRRRRP